MAALPGTLKISYFSLAGKAEATRLMLNIGEIEHEDERFGFQDWKDGVKATAKWGTAPFLTLADGKQIGQSKAMGRYVAKMTGLYPEDALQAAFVDDIVDGIDEIGPMVNGTGRGLEQAEKEAARVEEVTKGKVKAILDTVEADIKSLGDGAGHSVGSTLTFADIIIFTMTTNTFCGFFDGLSIDMLKDWPAIQSVNKTVSNHPAVRKYYDEGNGAKLAGMWSKEMLAAFTSARD